MLKKLTGADSISGDVKFGDYLQFTNSAKFLYGSNHVVLLPNKDAAFYDRLVVIPFAKSVPRDARDFWLEEKLNAERDAIIVQALAAYRRLVKSNYIDICSCFDPIFEPPIDFLEECRRRWEAAQSSFCKTIECKIGNTWYVIETECDGNEPLTDKVKRLIFSDKGVIC